MRIYRAILSLCLLLLATGVTYAQSERDRLRGVQVMRVLVERIESTDKLGSFNEMQLQADVELRLRKAGITVIDDKDATSASPYLYLNVNVLQSTTCDFRAYNTELSFHRLVTVFRPNNDMLTFANVWGKAYLGVRSTAGFPSTARETIAELVDVFINDYLAANPKR